MSKHKHPVVYLVWGHSGEYQDLREWPVQAFALESDAARDAADAEVVE